MDSPSKRFDEIFGKDASKGKFILMVKIAHLNHPLSIKGMSEKTVGLLKMPKLSHVFDVDGQLILVFKDGSSVRVGSANLINAIHGELND